MSNFTEQLTSFHQAAKRNTDDEQQTDNIEEVSEGTAAGDEEVPSRAVQVLMTVELCTQQVLGTEGPDCGETQDCGVQVTENGTASW